MFSDIALVMAGLVVLLVAGDLLVRGAVGLASALGVPTLLISLTIIAFGTSAPELVVSVEAVWSGNAGIALGNIIGSNIANILLVTALPAMIYPMSTHVPGLRRHAAVMLAATAVFVTVAFTAGHIGFYSGAFLFAGIIAYLYYLWMRVRDGKGEDPVLDDAGDYCSPGGISFRTVAFLVVGLVSLPLGAHLLVTHGAALAHETGVREEIIGLTVIAVGTSLPELATVASAALHRKSDVAIGNVIGSSIFNILAVGGAAGLAGTIPFGPATLRVEIPVLVLASLVLAAYVMLQRDIGRIAGALMLAGYAGFFVLLTGYPSGF